MIRDIDALKGFEPMASHKDPLKGFVTFQKGNKSNGNQLLGYSVSVSPTYMGISLPARHFLDSNYVELLFNVDGNQLALKPSSRTNKNAFLMHGHGAHDKLGRQIVVTAKLRDELLRFPNLNLERFRYHFAGELFDDGAAGVLIFDLSDPTDAMLLHKRGL